RGAPAPEETKVAALAPATPVPATPAPAAPASQTTAAPAAPEVKQPTLVITPMPIARPRNLILPEAAPEPVQTASLATTDVPLGKLMAAPMPPARPSSIIAPVIEAQAVASTSATEAANQGQPALPAGKLVAVLHPSPPSRPANSDQAASAKAAPPVLRPGSAASAPDKDKAALDLLFAGASRTTSSAPAKIVTAKARQVSPTSESFTPGNEPAAAFGFSRGKATDMSTDKFSGQAVKPLPSNFIQQ
ncbi:MAG: hypothetical protein ACRCWO_12965, partial [Bosea sp. (in: a-proteobacteria)]